MSNKIQTPFPLFSDINGLPLDEGFIYIGETGKDPEVYPVPVFWDENLTILAEQPVRTHNGYLSNYGVTGKLYISNDECSITVLNKGGTLIHTDLYADLSFTQTNANEKFKNVATNVESMADLIALKPSQTGQTIFLKSYFPNKNKGGGFFIYNEFSDKSSDGGMVVASSFGGNWERISLEAYHNVQWWGALGESTDDTDAIWRALQAHGSYTFNNLSNPTNASFCSIYFPQSSGTYVITRPIKLLPYMRIIGDSTKGGSLWGNSANWKSVIETRFPLAENYEWAITTMNYVRATGQPTTWDSNYSGNNYDSGIVTACFGSSVQDIVLVNLDTNKRVYGGIRMQNAPQCSVIGCYVQGFDFCVYSSGSWDSRFDVGTVSYKCGFGCYGDMNNACINGYHHGTKDGISPMFQQHPTAYINDSTSGLENYSAWANYKYGVIVKYAYGFTSQNLIAEYHDVGILFSQCTGTAGAIYTEKNTRGIATVAANVNIGSISGVQNTNSFAFGTGSRIDLPTLSIDHYVDSIRDGSDARYNSEILCPTTVNLAGPNVFYKNDTYRVFVNAVSGKDTNNGMISDWPVKTVDKAIEIISKQMGSDGNQRSSSGKWSIIITDSSVYVPLVWSTINQDVTFEAIGGTPKIQFAEAIFWAVDCKVCFKGISITRANNNNYQTSSGGIIAQGGEVEVSIIGGNTACLGAQALVSIDPDVTCNLTLTISDGTCSINNNSRFIELSKTKVVASSIKAAISQKFTGNVLSRADYGIESPSENITKVIIVNTSDSSKRVIP